MFKKLLILAASLLILGSFVAGSKKTKRWTESDEIDIDNTNPGAVASGSGPLLTDDEDDTEDTEGSADDSMSFSGDGSGSNREETTSVPEVTRPRTACQQLRSTVIGNKNPTFIYECTQNGEFRKLQCRSNPGECWCVDPQGREIAGTIMKAPEKPDCDFGMNLKPCVFQLLKNSIGLYGTYRPRCNFYGEYEQIQCHAVECWCVDSTGREKPNTRVSKVGSMPVCEETTTSTTTTVKPTTPQPTTAAPRLIPTMSSPAKTTRKHHHHQVHQHDKDKKKGGKHKPDKGYEVATSEDTDNTVLQTDKFDRDEEKDPDKTNNQINKSERRDAEKQLLHIMAKPGLLAAVIGGAVVGLLCAVLLVMFIVYRMRKKDEGSYALEEQKYTNYSYMKAPDKEFYA